MDGLSRGLNVRERDRDVNGGVSYFHEGPVGTAGERSNADAAPALRTAEGLEEEEPGLRVIDIYVLQIIFAICFFSWGGGARLLYRSGSSFFLEEVVRFHSVFSASGLRLSLQIQSHFHTASSIRRSSFIVSHSPGDADWVHFYQANKYNRDRLLPTIDRTFR